MRGISALCCAVVITVVSAATPLRAQENSGVGELFGSLVSPTTIEIEPPEAAAAPGQTLQEIARSIRATLAKAAPDASEMERVAALLETEQPDPDQAAQELRELSTKLRSTSPLEATRLEALASTVEEAPAGWYLTTAISQGGKDLSLRRVKDADPKTLEPGFLLALAPKEALYRIIAVVPRGDSVDVTLSPPARHAYSPGGKVGLSAERIGWLAGPSLRDAEDRLTTSMGFGGSYKGFELTLGYTNTDASGGGKDVESRSGKLKVPLRSRLYSNYNNQLALAFDTTEVRTVRQRHRALFTGNLGLDGGLCHFQCQTNLIANLGWAWDEPKAGANMNDLIGGVGIMHTFRSTMLLAVDYSFKNNLDRQDNFSVALTKKFLDSRLTFGVAKHGTTFASYVATF
jgi:hypothetical protein